MSYVFKEGIKLLYGLSKPAIKKMKSADIDEQLRKVDAEELDAARKLGPKTQKKLDDTRKALNEEKNIRKIRDKEYGVMQDELRGASELMPVTRPLTGGGGGGIDDLKRAYTGIFTEVGDTARAYTGIARGKGTDAGDLGRAYKGIFTGKRDDVIPEFSSKNLAMKEMENGVPSGYTLSERAGYMGPRLSSEGNPLKLKDMTFSQLDEAQQGVYKIVKQSDIEELSDPGVLSDLLDYSRRAGRGRDPKAIVSEYWETKGAKIRDYMSSLQSGDVPAGTQMDLLLD